LSVVGKVAAIAGASVAIAAAAVVGLAKLAKHPVAAAVEHHVAAVATPKPPVRKRSRHRRARQTRRD
jgi:hypothetical protein